MPMSSVITNDGSDVISRAVETEKEFTICVEDIDEVFCVTHTVSWIKREGFKHIGLQFPDELLYISTSVCLKLCQLSEEFCFILGDSSFAGCCVDEVAGQRFHIDALVHYGRACLSELAGRVPVLYVFGQLRPMQSIDSNGLSDVVQSILSVINSPVSPAIPSPIIITYDFRFQTVAYTLYQRLLSVLNEKNDETSPLLIWSEPDLKPPAESATPPLFGSSLPPSIFRRCGRAFHCVESTLLSSASNWALVHIGPISDNVAFQRILLGFPEASRSKSFLLDPQSFRLRPAEAALDKFIRRRSFLVEKAKDAQKVGILMGTLSLRGYQSIVARLQSLLKRFGRFHLTLVVGKLNAAKLANLPELDLLVLIACAETSLLDSREMLIPIVTPFELECALSSLAATTHPIQSEGHTTRVWNPDKLSFDFVDLLPGGASYLPESQVLPSQSAVTEEVADISLITGKLRLFQPVVELDNNVDSSSSSSALASRGDWALMGMENSSSSFQRTWFGLDPQLGQTPVAQILEGLHGLPVQYATVKETEHTCTNSTTES